MRRAGWVRWWLSRFHYAGLTGFILLVTCHPPLVPDLAAQGIAPNSVITTVAGNGRTVRGLGGPATSAGFGEAIGLARDSQGNIYFSETDGHSVLKISTSGTLSIVAGNGFVGFSGDGGPATNASLHDPLGLAFDTADNLYIADLTNDRIRKVTPDGIITTFSDSVPGPAGLQFDGFGNLYVSSNGKSSIFKITPAGLTTAVAGTGEQGFSGDGGPATRAKLDGPRDMVFDPAGNLYFADSGNSRIRKISVSGIITTVAGNGVEDFSCDGGPATSASLTAPWGVALDPAGNLYISANNRIRKVALSGTITTIAGGGPSPGDGGPATQARLGFVRSILSDPAGNLLITDAGNSRVRKVNAAGIITTIAGTGALNFSGDGGPATSAALSRPFGITVDFAGNLFIADTENHRVRKITASGIITTVAGNGIAGFSGDGGPATGASLNSPLDVAVDAAGNLYIVDEGNDRVRKVSPSGIITTVAGGGNAVPGNGGPATDASACPFGVAVDNTGSVYFSDRCYVSVRKVSPAGIISTVAGNGTPGYSGDGGPATNASLRNPSGVVLDAGNLYIADTGNRRVRQVNLAGVIRTVAGNGGEGFTGDGGLATATSLSNPVHVAVDATGVLYISMGTRVARVGPDGIIRTIAGGGCCFLGDGGPAIQSTLHASRGITLDAAGNLYIASEGSDRVRKVLVSPPSYSITPTSFSFTAEAGSGPVLPQRFMLTSPVIGLAWTAQITTENGGGWISVSPSLGAMPNLVDVSVNVATLVPGTYRGTVTLLPRSRPYRFRPSRSA